MSNELVKDPVIRILLERREEIRKKINKLQAEYAAIGELINRDQKRDWKPDEHKKDDDGR